MNHAQVIVFSKKFPLTSPFIAGLAARKLNIPDVDTIYLPPYICIDTWVG